MRCVDFVWKTDSSYQTHTSSKAPGRNTPRRAWRYVYKSNRLYPDTKYTHVESSNSIRSIYTILSNKFHNKNDEGSLENESKQMLRGFKYI